MEFFILAFEIKLLWCLRKPSYTYQWHWEEIVSLPCSSNSPSNWQLSGKILVLGNWEISTDVRLLIEVLQRSSLKQMQSAAWVSYTTSDTVNMKQWKRVCVFQSIKFLFKIQYGNVTSRLCLWQGFSGNLFSDLLLRALLATPWNMNFSVSFSVSKGKGFLIYKTSEVPVTNFQ